MRMPGLKIEVQFIEWQPGGRGPGGGGRSAALAAAYRAGTCLTDTYLATEVDYRAKGGVIARGFVGWEWDGRPETYEVVQQALWAAVDRAEIRADARTFWSLCWSLPNVLTQSQQAIVCQAICDEIRCAFGVAGDWALHEAHVLPEDRFGEQPRTNPHGHAGFTTREVDEGQFRPAKQRRLNAKSALLWIREMVARVMNHFLERWDYAVRVTHRSIADEYAAINADRVGRGLLPLEVPEPTRHLGPQATHLARQGEQLDVVEHNRRVALRNAVVLEFNGRVLALDEPILRERARRDISIIVEDLLAPVVGEGHPESGSAAIPELAAAHEAPSTATTPEAPPTLQNPGSVDQAHADLVAKYRTMCERQIELGEALDDARHRSAMDEHHRAEYEEARAAVHRWIEQLYDGDHAMQAKQWAEDPDRVDDLIRSVRTQAAERPGMFDSLISRVRQDGARAWETRRDGLVALADALERMERHRRHLRPATERSADQEVVAELSGQIQTLEGAIRSLRAQHPEIGARDRNRGGLSGGRGAGEGR